MADPLYRQIAEDLRQKIESGELAPASQLPTELELREHYGNASRNTVRDAIKWLTSRGLVVTQPGRGTFVVQKFRPFIVPLNERVESATFEATVRKQGLDPKITEPRVEIQNARLDVARELKIEPGTTVVSRHQRRFVNDSPSSLQTSWYPMSFVVRGATRLLEASDIKEGVTQYLEDKLGVVQAGYRDRLTVRGPDGNEGRFFQLPDTGAVLVVVIHRTAYDTDEKPIRYTHTVFPSDRNHFVFEEGSVPPFGELPA